MPKNDGTVMGINKRRIKIGSRAYKKLLKIGYVYDDAKKSLIYPIKVETFICVDGNWPPGLSDKIRSGEYSHLQVTTTEEVKTIPVEKLKAMKDSFAYTEGKNLSVEIYGKQKLVQFGPAFDGITNCVLESIKNHFQHYNYPITDLDGLDEFEDGVFEDDYEMISKKTKMRITVIVGKKEIVFGPKRNKRAQLKLYYHNNHVTQSIINYKDREVLFVKDLTIENSGVELCDIINIVRSSEKIYCISTNEKEFRLKFDGDVDLEKYDCFSATSYYCKQFIEDNPNIHSIHACHDNIEAIKSIVQNGITYCENMDKGWCIDLKRAYTNFENFSSYTGFPTDLSNAIDTDLLSETEILDILNDYEGFALIECDVIFNNKRITRWASFPYVRHRLKDTKSDIQIRFMMIGTSRTHLNLKAFKFTPKRALHKVFGKFISHTKNNSFTTTDPIVGMNFNGSIVCEKDNVKLMLCNSWMEKIGNSYYPHITSYVQQYTEIEIEKMYLELIQKNIPVFRIWVDGLTVPCDSLNKIKKIVDDNLWHIKESSKFEYTSELEMIEPKKLVKFSETLNKTLLNIDTKNPYKYCITGEAGCGKSYTLMQLYKQMNNCAILVPTHALKRNYPGMIVETIQLVVAQQINSYDILLIDEYSMIDEDMLHRIPNYDKKIIILAGDTAQLKPVNGARINTQDFNCVELTKNYRQKDKKFLQNLQKTRNNGDISWIQIIEEDEIFDEDSIVISSTNLDVDKFNKLGITKNPNEEVNGLKIYTPIKFLKTIKKENICAGDLGAIIEISPNDTVTVELDFNKDEVFIKGETIRDEKNEIIKYAYSQTIHSVQGKTIRDKKIIINPNRLFDGAMAYVAASRAVNSDQLFRLRD